MLAIAFKEWLSNNTTLSESTQKIYDKAIEKTSRFLQQEKIIPDSLEFMSANDVYGLYRHLLERPDFRAFDKENRKISSSALRYYRDYRIYAETLSSIPSSSKITVLINVGEVTFYVLDPIARSFLEGIFKSLHIHYNKSDGTKTCTIALVDYLRFSGIPNDEETKAEWMASVKTANQNNSEAFKAYKEASKNKSFFDLIAEIATGAFLDTIPAVAKLIDPRLGIGASFVINFIKRLQKKYDSRF